MANTKIKLTSNKMVECKQTEKVLVGVLYRYGYELRVVGFSEKKIVDILMREYRKAYKARNGCSPDADTLETVKDEIDITEFTLYEVIWQ